jgi:tetratricopeptide (TPR) repeat protein
LEAAGYHVSALDQMAALVNQSLVQQIEGVAGQPRFVLLETLREYALERLALLDELEDMRRRHALHFLALAEKGQSAFESADQQAWLAWLETEHDNFRAALSWSYTNAANLEIGFRLAGALWQFWLVRGYVSEGRTWIAGLLERAPVGGTAYARARVLNGAGLLAWARNDFRQATLLLQESLALFDQLGDTHGRAWVLNHLGQVALAHKSFAQTITLIQESLALFRAEGATWNIAWALINLGTAAWGQGDERQAEVHFAESLRLFRQTGDKRGIAWALHHLGRIAQAQADSIRARKLLTESLGLFRELNDTEGTAWILERLGWLALAQNDWSDAAALFGESLLLSRDLGHKWWIAWGLVGFAGVANMRDQPERAAQLIGAADTIFTGFDEPMELADWAYYHQIVAAITARLSAQCLRAARSAGQALSSEQAVGYALAEYPARIALAE